MARPLSKFQKPPKNASRRDARSDVSSGRSRSRRRLISAIVVVLTAALAGYYYQRSHAARRLPEAIGVAPGAAAGFNIVLFTLDTLRADRVGCYG